MVFFWLLYEEMLKHDALTFPSPRSHSLGSRRTNLDSTSGAINTRRRLHQYEQSTLEEVCNTTPNQLMLVTSTWHQPNPLLYTLKVFTVKIEAFTSKCNIMYIFLCLWHLMWPTCHIYMWYIRTNQKSFEVLNTS